MFSGMILGLALRNLLFLALHLENGSGFPKKLTKAQEQECIKRIDEGDESARSILIEHNLRLVAYIVKKYYPESKEQDDLISIGTIGLIRAAQTFSGSKSVNFSTYAGKCIDNQIKMYFRKIKHSQNDVYLNEPIDTDKDGNQLTIADIFKDAADIPDEVDLKMDISRLYTYVNTVLDEREQLIISKRYGIPAGSNPPCRPLPQREVADLLGISRSYVSRIEKKALEKLRGRFGHT